MEIAGITTLRDTDADRALGMTRGGNRYGYDENLGEGWEQYDTDQDAWYFGVWVNIARRKVFTYAEGDRILEIADTQEAFIALLREMDRFYGKAPPIAVCIVDISATELYGQRPGSELLAQGA